MYSVHLSFIFILRSPACFLLLSIRLPLTFQSVDISTLMSLNLFACLNATSGHESLAALSVKPGEGHEVQSPGTDKSPCTDMTVTYHYFHHRADFLYCLVNTACFSLELVSTADNNSDFSYMLVDYF